MLAAFVHENSDVSAVVAENGSGDGNEEEREGWAV